MAGVVIDAKANRRAREAREVARCRRFAVAEEPAMKANRALEDLMGALDDSVEEGAGIARLLKAARIPSPAEQAEAARWAVRRARRAGRSGAGCNRAERLARIKASAEAARALGISFKEARRDLGAVIGELGL